MAPHARGPGSGSTTASAMNSWHIYWGSAECEQNQLHVKSTLWQREKTAVLGSHASNEQLLLTRTHGNSGLSLAKRVEPACTSAGARCLP